jgi:hypothetical protein
MLKYKKQINRSNRNGNHGILGWIQRLVILKLNKICKLFQKENERFFFLDFNYLKVLYSCL